MTLANVAIISLLAVAAPLVARAFRRAAVPVVVIEILLGLAVGPNGLGWVEVDRAVTTLALLGVTFLFFLAGLDVDLSKLRGAVLGKSVAGYVIGLGLALALALALGGAGLVTAPLLVAIAFSATGLGLVVPILRNADLARAPAGAQIIAFASVAEFAAVVVLALAFSGGGSPAGTVVLLAGLAAAAVVVVALGERVRRVRGVTTVLDALSGGTVQLRVRLSVALVIGFAALAQLGGLEVVLGAFFAGGILNVLDGAMSDPVFRAQLDGLGYGFLIPLFFVASGARLDFTALSIWPDAVLLVPLLVATLLVARGVPALVLRVGDTVARRIGAGLMCATSLPFIVTAAQLGVASGRLAASTAAAMTTAGLIGVLLFPAIGVPLLRRSGPAQSALASAGASFASRERRIEYPKYTTNPSTSQMTNRSHVSTDRLSIRYRQIAADTSGSTGIHGTLNERGRSGRLRRRTSTPTLTSTNALRVPMLTISSSTPTGVRPATSATTTVTTAVITHGVRNVGCTLARPAGSRWSRLIAKITRLAADHQGQHDGRQARDRARGDDRRHPVLAVRGERVGQRRLRVELVVADHPGHHDRDRAVQDRADDQRAEDPDRQVPLRVARLLGGRRDDVEPDEREEHERRTGHDAAPAERGGLHPGDRLQQRLGQPGRRLGRLRGRDERVVVVRGDELDAGDDDEQHDEQLERDEHEVDPQRLLDPDGDEHPEHDDQHDRRDVDHAAVPDRVGDREAEVLEQHARGTRSSPARRRSRPGTSRG